MSLTLLALALTAAAPVMSAPAATYTDEPQLAAAILVSGEPAEAIARLERERELTPYDPAILINLGVAYAQAGDEAKAHDAFIDAASASQTVQVVTADGTQTDSRTLARRGLRMLERTDFASNGRSREQLTLRD